ncbi:MAG: aminodeoxychorismate synthase component I [Proteobacteria bacterium]|nr:aminodeoxychorismate synthase component I [Pseudomonadota bacterium]
MTHPLHPFSQHQTAALLAGLKDDFVFLETGKITDENYTSLLFHKPVARLQCVGDISPLEFLASCQDMLDNGFYLAGWFSYEFGLGLEPTLASLLPPRETILADLGVFNSPCSYDHRQGSWSHTDVPTDLPPQASCQVTNIRLNLTQENYEKNIAKIKSYIAAGDTYQVNYTLKLLFDFHGSADELFLQLRRNQLVSYSAYICHNNQRIMSFSPELFFRKEKELCTVRPMKGTSRRGRTLSEDQERIVSLQNDEKNRAENVMIVDLLRNDLGRLANMGSVEVKSLFDVETYESLLQMTSTITGKTSADLSLAPLFKALFPCGSVTGAPKIRTMEIIRELETSPRGVYTGAIGYLTPTGDALFNVPIRTVVLDGEKGEMGIGSGIVADSIAKKEWQECLLKSHFLSKPRSDFQLIETMLWSQDQGYWLLNEHLDRAQASARYFGYRFDKAEITTKLLHYQGTQTEVTARVRLLVDREGNITISHTPCPFPQNPGLPSSPQARKNSLPRTRLAAEQTDSSDIFLYHKTTQRKVYDRLWQEAQGEGYMDIIFTNERGEISEGAITNIFVEKEGVFYTPQVTSGLLPGIFRGYLLTTFPERVREKTLFAADLSAPGVTLYLGNSVRGLVQVELINQG